MKVVQGGNNRVFVVPNSKFAYRPKGKSSKAKEDAKNKASTSNEASTSNGGNMVSTSNHFDVLSKPDVNTNHIVEEDVAPKVADLGHSSEQVNEDSDSDVEEVYNQSANLLASGDGGARNVSFLEDEDYDLYKGFEDDIGDLTEEHKAYVYVLRYEIHSHPMYLNVLLILRYEIHSHPMHFWA
ncbi:hypothetical protein Tco_1157561 [Tanacetum coccineum]